MENEFFYIFGNIHYTVHYGVVYKKQTILSRVYLTRAEFESGVRFPGN